MVCIEVLSISLPNGVSDPARVTSTLVLVVHGGKFLLGTIVLYQIKTIEEGSPRHNTISAGSTSRNTTVVVVRDFVAIASPCHYRWL